MSSTPIDYSIRSLCYAHVDLPAEFFGGVPIHSGGPASTSIRNPCAETSKI